MVKILAQTSEVVTSGSINTWAVPPMAVGLVFGLAGSFFVGIYILRRLRNKGNSKEGQE